MAASRPQNPARRHHFLPDCYQKLWLGDDGKLERFLWDMTERFGPAGWRRRASDGRRIFTVAREKKTREPRNGSRPSSLLQ